MTGWTKDSANEFLSEIQGALDKLGFAKADIVGSVGVRGFSSNDLDLALSPAGAMTLDVAIERIETSLLPLLSNAPTIEPLEAWGAKDRWFIPIELRDGRVVEFYLDEHLFPLDDGENKPRQEKGG